jgi:hypothetical protein
MDINAKIKLLAETMSGYSVIVDSSNGANVELSKVAMPCILIFIQDTGEFLSLNSHYRDSVNIKVAVLNKIPKGFKESDVESMRYDLKNDMILLYHKLKFDFQFKINTESIKYEIVYDEFDDNLIGVTFTDNVKERVGLNLACETPDSIGEAPTSVSFCQKVSECSSIVSINQLLDDLQEQIDNLPADGVQSVSGAQVNNTDPLNPIIETLGLIKIIDLDGAFFTDLVTAKAYLRSMFNTPPLITDESFNSGIYYFTLPPNTIIDGYFLTDNITGLPNNASIIDELGMITQFSSGGNFQQNNGSNVLINCIFADSDFYQFTGTVKVKNIVDIFVIGGNSFGEYSTGKFIIEGNIGALESAQFVPFFRNSTSTIFVNAQKYSSNSGAIHGDLANAITNGCNVFFDGIDKENVSNKVTNFTVLDNDTYPTTQATKDLVDYYAQSNIRVVGDWDATSGSYPLSDESNTTPFISQWGSVIKQGFAFRVGYGQAGTVDGFDYENGDVVYALIDSPTDNASDWGDLDHNLQQADESLRGTAKIVTAAIIADETSTDDERIVTTKKLWLNFWTRVLAIAHTFAAKITFTTAPRFNSVAASQYLKVDATKDLTSVSAIPAADVTQNSTNRFITDAERIKWNSFLSVIGSLGAPSVSNILTVSNYILIPANTLKIGGALTIRSKVHKVGNSSYAFNYLYVNTSLAAGGVQLGTNNTASNNTFSFLGLERTIPVQVDPFYVPTSGTIVTGSEGCIAASSGTKSIDWTVDQYVIHAVRSNGGTDTVTSSFLMVKEE